MAILSLVVELNLVKCRQKFGCLSWGKCVEESDILKIKGNDDDIISIFSETFLLNIFSDMISQFNNRVFGMD